MGSDWLKKEGLLFPLLVFIFMAFTGCGVVGDENISLAVIYGVCLLLSLLLLTAYCAFCKTKDKWFLLVFISVFVVNLGYFALSCSQNLKQALWANRIAYFGSVFLPLAMFMIILKVTNIRYRSRLTIVLFCISLNDQIKSV